MKTLKTTYKASNSGPSLPEGWTEHKAPSGHLYYYNANTKKSTYDRPSTIRNTGYSPSGRSTGNPILAHELPDIQFSQASHQPYQPFNRPALAFDLSKTHHTDVGSGLLGIGDGGESRGTRQRPRHQDRPKSKSPIPGCEPWILVETKLGRRFVYNPDINESFWKFPPHITKAVVEFDRREREKRTGQPGNSLIEEKLGKQDVVENGLTAADRPMTNTASRPESGIDVKSPNLLDSEGEECEEVEVTDDDEDPGSSKRQNEALDGKQTVDFNEDDIAYQLAAMGQDYGLDPGEYGLDEYDELEAGAEGLPLTEEDSNALFKDLLNDYRASPYSTWEKIIEAGQIVEDDRYTVLPSMRARKEVWEAWSRDQIQLLKEKREKEEQMDPRITYLAFLQSYATPKLYWPEFRRKYQKEHEMRSSRISDKDREKWYREYINRLKLPESTLKSDLVKFLKSLPLYSLNNSSGIQALPPIVMTDLRYASLRASARDPLISAHISTLASPPEDVEFSPEQEAVLVKEKDERRRREQAFLKRQQFAEENKRKQRGTLQYSKGVLREGAQEIEQAMNVGKNGLLGHIAAMKAGEDVH